MKKRNYAEVNSSYTVFFLISALSMGIVLGNTWSSIRSQSTVTIILFVFLVYFVWDMIKQLYSASQAFFLYVLVLIILPFILGHIIDFPIGIMGIVIVVGSTIIAGIMELVYELLIKKRLNKKVLSRLLAFDNSLDKSIIEISKKHIQLTEYRGFVFAIILAISYFVFAYAIFHL